MTFVSLSKHDINVLEKIKDPETNPFAGVVLDSSIPRDPHLSDDQAYEAVVEEERHIIRTVQKLEAELQNAGPGGDKESAVEGYRQCLAALEHIISEHPDYASARNNRVQVLRRLYGDALLLRDAPTPDTTTALVHSPERAVKMQAASAILNDAETSIKLLSPASLTSPISPQAARTLSMAHTQRAAVYLKTAKLLLHQPLEVDGALKESQWEKLDFEEAASRDLALGGRYGNPIAKGLAVSVNPTAKLCGEIVQEAMRKEYGSAYGG